MKSGSYISSFPCYYNSETIVGELVKFQKMFWFHFIEFKLGISIDMKGFVISNRLGGIIKRSSFHIV